jgi:hypothetical protein
VKKDCNRLLKNTHLLRCALSSSLRRTEKYTSFLAISRALHRDVFDEPERKLLFQRPGKVCDRGGRVSVGRSAVLAFWGFLIFIVGSCSTPAPDSGNMHLKTSLPPVEFKASVDKAAATVGDSIMLTLSLSSEPQIAVRLPDAGSQITGLRIVDAGEEGPKPVDNRTMQKKWYKLQADLAGTYIIPALSISYTDAAGAQQEQKSAQLFIEVTSAPHDQKQDAGRTIRDIKPPQDIPWSPGKPFIYGLLVALLLIAGGALLFYYSGKKRQPPAPIKPAHIRAFEELEQLTREQLIEKGIVREYYFRLSEIFRRYIERRFQIPAVERTTEEIMPAIARLQICDSAIKAETREILCYADLVKFARFCPDRKTSDTDYQRVVRVIEETKEVPPVADAANTIVPAR